MIVSLTLILLCQLVGEALAAGSGWPIPGPVIGMALLLMGLLARDRLRPSPEDPDGPLQRTASGLLAHLSLLFVPAGVGVLQRLDVIGTYGLGLAVALLVSTVLAILATAGAFLLAARFTSADGDERGTPE